MTQRSISAGADPTVIIKSGLSVVVKGYEGDQVIATTGNHWGLKIEKHSLAEIARARAAVGSHVLFDLRFKKAGKDPGEAIEVQIGASGEVQVPFGSKVKVYAGKDIEVKGIHTRVDAYAGGKIVLHDVYGLGIASAGSSMDLDCATLLGEKAEFRAGSDIRFHIADLTNAYFRVNDIGGYWEARMGDGVQPIILKSGGDVIIVTNQEVVALPPNFVLGKIEKPSIA